MPREPEEELGMLEGEDEEDDEDLKDGDTPRSAIGALLLVLLGVVIGGALTFLAINFATPSYRSYLGLVLPTPKPASLYQEVLRGARYIDMSHAMHPGIPVWPGFASMSTGAAVAGSDQDGFISKGQAFTYAKHGFQATQYHMTTDQYGTQLDAPAHWWEYGATLSDLPATIAVRPLVVIDISAKVQANPKYAAAMEDVEAWEAQYGKVPAESVVFFRSDWSKKWNSPDKADLLATWPGVSLKVLQFLHLKRNILFHGHEPLDTDMTVTLEGEAWLMHNNFLQAEGVTNLDQVDPQGCLVSIGFPRFKGGTGGYARYVAICPGHGEGGERISSHPGAPLPQQDAPLRRRTDGVLVPDPTASPTAYCEEPTTALGCPLPATHSDL